MKYVWIVTLFLSHGVEQRAIGWFSSEAMCWKYSALISEHERMPEQWIATCRTEQQLREWLPEMMVEVDS